MTYFRVRIFVGLDVAKQFKKDNIWRSKSTLPAGVADVYDIEVEAEHVYFTLGYNEPAPNMHSMIKMDAAQFLWGEECPIKNIKLVEILS